jgi:hypothetical protein
MLAKFTAMLEILEATFILPTVIPAQAGIQALTRGRAETETYFAADAARAGFPPARE